jgi:hypothetical protein
MVANPNQQLLDALPIGLILVLLAVAMLAAYEIGFRLGRWYQERTPGEQEGPTGVLVGSLLALMAFMLAIVMGMAADRFDNRRALVMDEATTIQTAYLRAGYQPAPADEEVRELLREYVPLRISTADRSALAANLERSLEIQGQLWAIAERLVETTENTDLLALFVESINDVIEVHDRRLTAGLYARVPESVVWLLLGGSVLALGMVGYGAGLTGRRSLVGAVVLVVALSAVTVLVVDLDRPQDGLLRVSQQPLIDLQRQIGPPSQ